MIKSPLGANDDKVTLSFQASPEYEGLFIEMECHLTDDLHDVTYTWKLNIEAPPANEADRYATELVCNETACLIPESNSTSLENTTGQVNQTAVNLKKFEELMEIYSYLFSGGQVLSDPAVIEFIRATIPFPVPYVSFIGRSGLFNIKFTRNIALEQNLKESQGDDEEYELDDYVRNIVESQHMRLSIVPKGFLGKADSTEGTPYFAEENFKGGRRLRKSSLNFSGKSSAEKREAEQME